MDRLLYMVMDLLCRHVREWFPMIPAGLLIAAGYTFYRSPGGDLWGRVEAIGLLLWLTVCTTLICNPFRLLSHVLAPASRGCIVGAASLAVGAVELPLDGYFRAVLWLIAALLIGLVKLCGARWLRDSLVRQDPTVDRLLDGGHNIAVDAWEQHGAAQSRALMHQSCDQIVDETTLHKVGGSTYQLGYLQGAADLERQRAHEKTALKAKDKEIYALQSDILSLRHTVDCVGDYRQELEHLKRENAGLRASLAEIMGQKAEPEPADQAEQAEGAEGKIIAFPAQSQQEQLDAAMLRYYEQGHSYAEVGAAYGYTKGGAYSAVQRARKACSAGKTR